jgi:hypothetical protein
MATEWVVTAPAERVELDNQNKGETTFTVTNRGTTPDRVVFEVVPGDGAEGSWFSIDEPQRVVAGGASATFLVRVAVKAGTPEGSPSLQGRAYSADTAPEEGSRLSGRVAFDVRATEKPKRPWWPYAVAAAVVLVVLGVVAFLVFGGDGGPIRSGTVNMVVDTSVDFETGILAAGEGGDVYIDPNFPGTSDPVFRTVGSARLESIGVVPQPTLSSCPRQLGGTFADLEVPVGTVICVLTTEGNIAVVTIAKDPFQGPPLVLRYELFEAP